MEKATVGVPIYDVDRVFTAWAKFDPNAEAISRMELMTIIAK